jgi:hypothetical protein
MPNASVMKDDEISLFPSMSIDVLRPQYLLLHPIYDTPDFLEVINDCDISGNGIGAPQR